MQTRHHLMPESFYTQQVKALSSVQRQPHTATALAVWCLPGYLRTGAGMGRENADGRFLLFSKSLLIITLLALLFPLLYISWYHHHHVLFLGLTKYFPCICPGL